MSRNLRDIHRLACRSIPAFYRKRFTRTLQVQEYSKFSSGSGNLNNSLTNETAYELVLNLNENERSALKTALDKLESNVIKQQLEGKLSK